MTFAARETSRYQGQPFELFLFTTLSTAYTYTSGDVKRTYSTRTYTPLAIKRTEIDQGIEQRSGSMTVTVPRTSDLAALFVSYIPESPLQLTIYQGHDGDPDGEVRVAFTGSVIAAKFGDFCELTCAPDYELTKRKIPAQEFSSLCPWVVYGPGCQVDKASFKVDGTLTAFTSSTVVAAAYATKPDGWFRGGYVELGANRRLVVAHIGNTLTLAVSLPGAAVGAVVSAYAGCNRTQATCNTKFNNLARFWGFPHIPSTNPFGSSGFA